MRQNRHAREFSTIARLVVASLLAALLVAVPVGNESTSAAPSESFIPLTPARLLETRGGPVVGAADGNGAAYKLNVLNKGGLPGSGIGAVALNVTVAPGGKPNIGGGYVTVYPCGTRPDASNLNFTDGQVLANSVIAPVSSSGDVCFYVYGTAHLLADVSGYFPGTGTDTGRPTPDKTVVDNGFYTEAGVKHSFYSVELNCGTTKFAKLWFEYSDGTSNWNYLELFDGWTIAARDDYGRPLKHPMEFAYSNGRLECAFWR
jgi:hypothetical protein